MTARKNKITASIVGQIFKMRPTTVPHSLIKTIRQEHVIDLSYIPAIAHGRAFESKARDWFAQKYLPSNCFVQERGFMLHNDYDWLGASVDGLVISNDGRALRTVEIKCPLLKKGEPTTLRELAASRKSWFLECGPCGLQLKKNHNYYLQCQTQMACWGLKECSFYTYLATTEGSLLDDLHCTISYDENLMMDAIQKCKDFHQNYC